MSEQETQGPRPDGPRVARLAAALLAGGLLAAAALALVALLLWRGSTPPAITDPDGEPPELSLFALGDTGKRHRWLARWTEGQLAVAQGLVAEDLRRPVAGLILLGDNFYMRGLEAHELVERVRQNVVLPYCHFLDLRGPRSAEVASACSKPQSERNPIPFYTVLGNHDTISPDSPRLQREVVPQLVPSWYQGTRDAEVHELPGGVSLILLREQAKTNRSPASLAEALRRSQGPFRIVAAHRPAAVDDYGGVPRVTSYYEHVPEASRLAGVPIHLFLAGHHHSLQVITLEAPSPILNVVAGSGSRRRRIERPHPARRFAGFALGFARIDLVKHGDEKRLVASLFATPTYPALTRSAPELVARWSVGSDGQTRDELGDG